MSANLCRFRFYGDLNDFLPAGQRGRWIDYAFDGTVAVKHPIESLGVPHPEVEQIVVDGSQVHFDYRLRPGKHVRVYPQRHALLASEQTHLRPPLPRPARFVLDTHLGRLAAYLRMLGFDAVYENDLDDDALARIAHDDDRVLLTRDRGLLKRSKVVYGYCVRRATPRDQIVDTVHRYGLAAEATPWRRCVRCNGLLEAVEKSAILDQLEPKTKLYYDDFQRCASCGQIFWRGSHHERMRTFLSSVLDEAGQPAPYSPQHDSPLDLDDRQAEP